MGDQTFTLEIGDGKGGAWALRKTARELILGVGREDPTITIRLGFDAVTISQRDWNEMVRQLQLARDTGVHPDDIKRWEER